MVGVLAIRFVQHGSAMVIAPVPMAATGHSDSSQSVGGIGDQTNWTSFAPPGPIRPARLENHWAVVPEVVNPVLPQSPSDRPSDFTEAWATGADRPSM